MQNETLIPKNTSAPVSFTQQAAEEIKRILTEKNISDTHGLRIGVKGGGCSGFSYIMGFDTAKEHDEIFEIANIKLIVQKSHGIYLAGMEIDYLDDLNNRGFIFNNPNADKTCGCGSSFSA